MPTSGLGSTSAEEGPPPSEWDLLARNGLGPIPLSIVYGSVGPNDGSASGGNSEALQLDPVSLERMPTNVIDTRPDHPRQRHTFPRGSKSITYHTFESPLTYEYPNTKIGEVLGYLDSLMALPLPW